LKLIVSAKVKLFYLSFETVERIIKVT